MEAFTTNISVNPHDLQCAERIFSDLGMDLSTAIGLFLRQTVIDDDFPFVITRHSPKAETLEAMREFDEMVEHPERYKTYETVEELMEDIFSDEVQD